ncbi:MULTISPECIES: hypothetical protein [unclassified Streptomyces]|uniref:hypothetical protein n=1 Tax=unclassified Streptomyces TaxID=2593676 RepID=UPI002E185C90|nr:MULTISPECIES: hypothetical protein [unclassified Streptomyces]
MTPRTRITVFVISVSLGLVSGLGSLAASKEWGWGNVVTIIGMTGMVVGLALALRDYRRGRWPK